MPDEADKTIPSSADITLEKSANMRQSVEGRKERQLSLAENSPTTPQTPTMTIVANFL